MTVEDPADATSAVPQRPNGAFARLTASARRVRYSGGLVMVAAVVLLALNLRPAVNALGVVIPQLQDDTGLSGTVAGVVLALPTLCFAAMGFLTAPLTARIGSHRAVFVALVALTGGQLLRALVSDTWALFAGSILALAGIAVGNVLLPGLIRLHFPSAIGPMTAVYTTALMVGQTLGAGITLPVERALGGNWQLGIGMWAATAAVALVPWVVAAARHPVTVQASGPAGDGGSEDSDSARDGGSAAGRVRAALPRRPISVVALVRSGHAWAMAVFFGMQSLQAYVVFGWMPTILTDAGLSEPSAAGMIAIVTACGIPISAVVPTVLGMIRRHEVLVVGFVACTALGYAGLMASPTTMTWLLALLIGIGLGAFPMGLTLMALRARSPEGTTALSAFGQSVGYLLASAGPVGVGILHDATDGWTVPLVAMLITLLPMLIGGLVVVRRWAIEDDLGPRSHRHTP